MSPKQRFELVYAPQVKQHLRAIERKHYALIREEIDAQLLFGPEMETRNRMPLKRLVESGAEWELRFGPGNQFRVFYELDSAMGVVHILAIGTKEREPLYIGGEEVTDQDSTSGSGQGSVQCLFGGSRRRAGGGDPPWQGCGGLAVRRG